MQKPEHKFLQEIYAETPYIMIMDGNSMVVTGTARSDEFEVDVMNDVEIQLIQAILYTIDMGTESAAPNIEKLENILTKANLEFEFNNDTDVYELTYKNTEISHTKEWLAGYRDYWMENHECPFDNDAEYKCHEWHAGVNYAAKEFQTLNKPQ